MREDLKQLLAFIKGENSPLGSGIHTHPLVDQNNENIHAACLELEQLGLIECVSQHFIWKPVKGVVEPVQGIISTFVQEEAVKLLVEAHKQGQLTPEHYERIYRIMRNQGL